MRSAMVLASALVVCALFGAAIVGCLSKPQFQCAADPECAQGQAQGTCQPDGFCSFPDPSCPSGQRYGDLSGPQANQCVGEIPPVDASGIDARVCYGGGAYEVCVEPPPTSSVTLAGTLDTDADPRCTAAGWSSAQQPAACMIAGGSINIDTVVVTGSKPLVIAGDTIIVNGVLDVASHRDGARGPGAPSPACLAFPVTPETDPQGGGGGAGGSFRSRGGDGGRGDGLTNGGRAAPGVTAPAVLRAGCPGQTGGAGLQVAGAPGQGGGAVVLAASTITFNAGGTINASGAGAASTAPTAGGSGGGSGGMIVLHAPTISGTGGARLVANGGGGAAGSTPTVAGAPGSDPSPATPNQPAAGGSGTSSGGDGAAGGSPGRAGQSGNNRGGGGGGGGAGHIQSNQALPGFVASPAPTIVP